MTIEENGDYIENDRFLGITSKIIHFTTSKKLIIRKCFPNGNSNFLHKSYSAILPSLLTSMPGKQLILDAIVISIQQTFDSLQICFYLWALFFCVIFCLNNKVCRFLQK